MIRNLKMLAFMAILVITACKKNELITSQPESSKAGAAVMATTNVSAMAVTATYYIDAVNGKDSFDGKSPATAWRTITKVNQTTFQPGNVILFKCGQSWTNRLHPLGSGTNGSPIVIGRYGDTTLRAPLIQGGGNNTSTIYLYNQAYWEINDIEVTNFSSTEEGQTLDAWESNNQSYYANGNLPDRLDNSSNHSMRLGILIQAQDKGSVNHIYLRNVLVHGVNGKLDATDDTKYNGGIYFNITGTSTPTYFNDILIDRCTVRDVDRTGLFFGSTWKDRTLTDPGNWQPSLGVIVRNSYFTRSGANALIIRVTDHALIERNLFDHCAIKGSGNAAFAFSSDYAKFQYNECRYTKANKGDDDAGGLDADFYCKNTIIQYNYLHNNDFGLLITGGGFATSFNDGTQVKFNIIEKDGTVQQHDGHAFMMRISGSATNTLIYNNVIDIGPSQTGVALTWQKSWNGKTPSNTTYYNNIYDNGGTGSTFEISQGSNTKFDYNAFYRNAAARQPTQVHPINGDVKFVNPGSGNPAGFKLKAGSVALGAGVIIPNSGAKDYFGNPISPTSAPNVGAYNGKGL
ncbi:hypothetical protein [Mucilaginibacter agri]|uniref:Right handed beta helix region n=1 Tax=Mucilaginibacter agri TaxID=2695265 RepID=A0A965ZLU8_9SPHI|nr:hypothetical protein [Mucilaginibacter agri]NCD72432.1 hypothetical protein [Mucilaginibacter agri]